MTRGQSGIEAAHDAEVGKNDTVSDFCQHAASVPS